MTRPVRFDRIPAPRKVEAGPEALQATTGPFAPGAERGDGAGARFVAGSGVMLQLPVLAGYAPSGSLADPPNGSVIVAAVDWLQGTLLGTVATSVAVIAIAWVGLMLLSGRVSVRYGFTVFLGCFILFGAALISAGLRGSLEGGTVAAAPPAPAPRPPPAPLPPPRPVNADPYAGAAVPSR